MRGKTPFRAIPERKAGREPGSEDFSSYPTSVGPKEIALVFRAAGRGRTLILNSVRLSPRAADTAHSFLFTRGGISGLGRRALPLVRGRKQEALKFLTARNLRASDVPIWPRFAMRDLLPRPALKESKDMATESQIRNERSEVYASIRPLIEKVNRGERLSAEESRAMADAHNRILSSNMEIFEGRDTRALSHASTASMGGAPG